MSVPVLRACLAAIGTALGLCGLPSRSGYVIVLGACFVACAVVGDGRK